MPGQNWVKRDKQRLINIGFPPSLQPILEGVTGRNRQSDRSSPRVATHSEKSVYPVGTGVCVFAEELNPLTVPAKWQPLHQFKLTSAQLYIKQAS